MKRTLTTPNSPNPPSDSILDPHTHIHTRISRSQENEKLGQGGRGLLGSGSRASAFGHRTISSGGGRAAGRCGSRSGITYDKYLVYSPSFLSRPDRRTSPTSANLAFEFRCLFLLIASFVLRTWMCERSLNAYTYMYVHAPPSYSLMAMAIGKRRGTICQALDTGPLLFCLDVVSDGRQAGINPIPKALRTMVCSHTPRHTCTVVLRWEDSERRK